MAKMLKIHRSVLGGHVVYTLCGRMKEENVPELTGLLGNEKGASSIALDLEEVRLVDRQVVRFLAGCEARGIALENCPAFVREWILRGSDTDHESNSSTTIAKPRWQHGV